MWSLSADELRAAGACDQAVKAFDAAFPKGVISHDDMKVVVATALKGGILKYYGWAITKGLLPVTLLVGADLWGADLGGADLGGADLGGADLWGANLRGANLRGADLVGAKVTQEQLKGAVR